MPGDARVEFRDWSKNDLVREVLKLRRLLAEQMSAAPGIGDEVVVEAIVAVSDGRPQVRMRAGEAAWQMTPQQAREHATVVLERAIEADRDAAVVAWLGEAGFDEAAIGGFLMEMREHRTVFIEGRESEAR
jgi:hypothetical protein